MLFSAQQTEIKNFEYFEIYLSSIYTFLLIRNSYYFSYGEGRDTIAMRIFVGPSV